MPELPEVETTLRGIAPHLLDHKISRVIVREPRLRWPVSEALKSLTDAPVTSLSRRAKYLILTTATPYTGNIIIHLGMSGSLRIVDSNTALKKHDHIDFQLSSLVHATALPDRQLILSNPSFVGIVLDCLIPPDARVLLC